uniref:Ig-like domain-containing protein n=1 Tax=Equus caballus TaxID=9796 RepID=A0A9L0S6E6_HORSE
MLSWTRGSLRLSSSSPSNPGVLELPRVELGHHGKYVCRAQHLLGSLQASLSLFVTSAPQNLTVHAFRGNSTGISCSCPHISGEQRGTWPLVLTLLRGALMGAGFLLTYGLT